jgi:hypothetical protein
LLDLLNAAVDRYETSKQAQAQAAQAAQAAQQQQPRVPVR